MAARGRQTDSPSSPTAGAYLEIDTPVPATSGNALVVWTPTRSATEEFYSPHITGTVAKRPVVSNENKEPSSEMGDPSEQAPNGPDDTVPTLSLSQVPDPTPG
jgi:hypothetical protein